MNRITENNSGNLVLEVNENGMEAYLTIKLTDDVIDEKEIENLITEAGIKYGFEDAVKFNIDQGIEKEYDKPFLIAKGGLDPFKSELICKFEAESCYAPGKDPSRVSLTGWCYVTKGTKLAEVEVDETSNAVKNVYGETIEKRDLHTLYSSQYIGRNVTFKESERAIYSTIDGYPYLENNGKVGVVDVLELNGELLNEQNYLHFRSNVEVNGDIKNCKYISIEGNLIVHGDIENSSIYCTGSILIDGAVSGCKPLGLISCQNITFANGRVSFLFAGNNIQAERQVIDSRMVAGIGIAGSMKTCELTGGSVFAGRLITAAYAGDRFGTSTRIEIVPNCWHKSVSEHLTKIIENKVYSEAVIIDELKTVLSELPESPSIQADEETITGINFYGKVFPGVEMVINEKVITVDKVENRIIIPL
ncbi:MAG: DUF342 domain-containing protein [Candidatus Cloacimonetes bacterium]|nr:DUF342 domain-containing protein [Candidatus Cloacimonadota bacterium]